MPGLPVALVPCEDGNEETADAAQDPHSAGSAGKSFRNAAEAQQAIRCACCSFGCAFGECDYLQSVSLQLMRSLQGYVAAA